MITTTLASAATLNAARLDHRLANMPRTINTIGQRNGVIGVVLRVRSSREIAMRRLAPERMLHEQS